VGPRDTLPLVAGVGAPSFVPGQSSQMTDEEIVARALCILESRARHGDCLRDYLRLRLSLGAIAKPFALCFSTHNGHLLLDGRDLVGWLRRM
jgi:hypothetical protein